MDLSNTPATVPAVRHDGWTEVRKVHFLEHLAGHGNVRAACSSVGMSHEAAYRLRRRDPLFARAWGAALVLAREASAEVLACRAIDGIEEEVWYRGELRGTRRRYDSRLLLAHMARLDALAASGAVADDAARFDELLACVAGVEPPAELPVEDHGLPGGRDACIAFAGEEAEAASLREDDDAGEDEDSAACSARHDRAVARWRRARTRAAEQWDAWQLAAHAAVDRLCEQPLDASEAGVVATTPSTPSTSDLAPGSAGGHPGAA
jgi:hypothetical protein